MYAKDFGVPLAVARERLANQPAVDAYAADLEQRFPDRVAGIWFEHKPEYRLVVRLTAGASDTMAVPSSIGVTPVRVRADAARSLRTLRAELERLRPRIDRDLPGVGTGIDVRTGEITVHTTGSTVATAGSVVDRLRLAGSVPIRIRTHEQPLRPTNIHGGKRLSECTSGFTVQQNNGGAKGFITAGHCRSDQVYFETAARSYHTTYQSELWDGHHDVQWHTVPTGGNVYPRFYASSDSTPRDLTGSRGRDQQQVGDYVCHRGRVTKYSCGNIEEKDNAPDHGCNVGRCANVWMLVEGPSLACFGGDSGGPFFVGNIAVGVTSAGATTGTAPGDCEAAVYMAINYASDLGVHTLRA
jgi:streptogrisin C